jgi:uncharacterized protein (TIGR00297 family)
MALLSTAAIMPAESRMDPMIALDPTQLALGAGLALLVAGAGYAAGSLTAGGALGAFGVGSLVFGLGGPIWGVLLVVFFASSSLLSEWHAADKAGPAERFAKGSRRDLGQVLANGGIPALLALAQALWPALDLLPALVGALAAATADTWATEVGLLSVVRPRLITTGRPVPPGTSGGVTVLGTSAAAAGGLVIGLAAAVLVGLADLGRLGLFSPWLLDPSGLRFLLLAPVAGLASSAVDSWLGATLQAVYRDPATGGETERPRGPDGTPHDLIRGWPWLTNDAVNLCAGAAGAILTWGLDRLLWG